MKKSFSPVLAVFLAAISISFSTLLTAQTTSADSQRLDRQAAVERYNQLQRSSGPSADDASLDASTIIALLQSQPALALQIKKILIKDALDQGRLLEEQDLSDPVLYDLVRREPDVPAELHPFE